LTRVKNPRLFVEDALTNVNSLDTIATSDSWLLLTGVRRFKLDIFHFSPDPSSSRQTFQKSDSPKCTLTQASISIRLEAAFVEGAAPLLEAAFTRLR
jgi:hypothetical protein